MICKFSLQNDKKVIWEITNRCNYNCKYCIFSANHDFNELSTLQCKHIIDELIKNNFTYIKFTGGEPFIRKDLFELLNYANKKIKFDISTNASFIKDEHIDVLKQIDLNFVHVSVDGLKEEHEFLRGKNTFEPTINGLKKIKKANKYIRIGTVLYKGNEYKIKEIINMLELLDVDEIIFSIMEPFGTLNGNRDLCITRNLEDITNEIENINSKIKISYNWKEIDTNITQCPAGKQILFIDNNGFVSPCTWAQKVNNEYKSKDTLINTSLDSILDIFNINSDICLYDEVIYGKCKKCN